MQRAPPPLSLDSLSLVGIRLKLGMSTWSLLGLDVATAVRRIGDAGLEYVELWGEVPHAYPGWAERSSLADALSSYKMVVTLHAPFTDLNPASPFEPVKSAVEKALEGCVEFAISLGARVVTFHPGSVHSGALVPKSVQSTMSTLTKMVKAAGGRAGINVENQSAGRSKYHFPLGSTPESIDEMLGGIEGLNFTLDTGHANANGRDPASFVRTTGSRLTEVHLHDNRGTADDHLLPGEGNAALGPFMASLPASVAYVCLELDPYRYSPDEAVRGAASLKLDGVRTGRSAAGSAAVS